VANHEDRPTPIAKVEELGGDVQGQLPEDIRSIEMPTLLICEDSDIVRPEHAVERFRLLGSVDGTRISYRGVPGHGTCMSRRSHRLVDLHGRRVPAPKRSPAWTREAYPRGHALDAELEFEFEPGTGMRIAVRIRPR
jgi:hypothetical protein